MRVMEAEIAGALAQFGVAGMVGWMWLSERRAAAMREQQLTQAHEALMRDRESAGVLVEIAKANTRAMTALETTQREMISLLHRIGQMLRRDGSADNPEPNGPNLSGRGVDSASGRAAG